MISDQTPPHIEIGGPALNQVTHNYAFSRQSQETEKLPQQYI
jgi:hypothetical protein